MSEVNALDGITAEYEIADLLCTPQVLVDLIEACLKQSSLHSLVDIIMQDAALTARVLHAASRDHNCRLSATEPVTSAVQQLGQPLLTGLALHAARQLVCHDLSREELAFQYQLWFRSRVGGTAARCLAPSVNYPYVEEAQLGGLLNNLGIQLLFARHRSHYLATGATAWSEVAQSVKEDSSFKIDHLSLADQLVGSWGLDSFLADALRFLHADIEHVERSSPMLKIARLAQQFCQQPEQITPEFETLAARLFSFSHSEASYLFDWTHGLYAGFSALARDLKALTADFERARQRLTELTFLLADQEAARARLAVCADPQSLTDVARRLYLENSTALDVVLLVLDHGQSQFNGIPATGQSRMVSELKVPAAAGSGLVAEALSSGELKHSFTDAATLTVTDQLLVRLTRGQGIACLPLVSDGELFGAVVFGLAGRQGLAAVESLWLKMLSQVVVKALTLTQKGLTVAMADGGSLLWRVSHEISNPLTIITNYAEVLKQALQGSANAELPETIKKEVRRVADVVNYYLHKQDDPDIPEQNVDLGKLIKDAVDALSDGVLKAKNIQLRQRLQKDLGPVAINAMLVKQILINLIRNAAEAVAEGGQVEIRSRSSYIAQKGLCAELIVSDNGPGIAPQVLQRLFQPVTSTKGAGHGGVGLNIVKSMVDDLGGQISCHSSQDHGTSFHLLIPLGTEQHNKKA